MRKRHFYAMDMLGNYYLSPFKQAIVRVFKEERIGGNLTFLPARKIPRNVRDLELVSKKITVGNSHVIISKAFDKNCLCHKSHS